MINMLIILMDKVDSMLKTDGEQKHENSKNPKEMLEIKNTAAEMQNAFDGLIGRLGAAEGQLLELKDISTETSPKLKNREKKD